jgi:hypothetical protein
MSEALKGPSAAFCAAGSTKSKLPIRRAVRENPSKENTMDKPDAKDAAQLGGLTAALTFIREHLDEKKAQATLEGLDTYQQVSALAAQRGFKFTHTEFAEAMKIVVDRSLERAGIPSWVRHRVHAPVHD